MEWGFMGLLSYHVDPPLLVRSLKVCKMGDSLVITGTVRLDEADSVMNTDSEMEIRRTKF